MIAVASVAPVLLEPSLTAGQLTQMVMGEAATVSGRDGAMVQVRTMLDDCVGWTHSGYLREADQGEATSWLATAAWSEGATVLSGGVQLRVPHRGRLQLEGSDWVRLPDGRQGRIVSGSIRHLGEVFRDAARLDPASWAWREFGGSPFLWGGVTTAGIDCSGLVQVTLACRGVSLPRDPAGQSLVGEAVPLDQLRSGDLVYFRSRDSDEIGHVAIHAGDERFVHATIHTGQVSLESWQDNERTAALRDRAVLARRLA